MAEGSMTQNESCRMTRVHALAQLQDDPMANKLSLGRPSRPGILRCQEVAIRVDISMERYALLERSIARGVSGDVIEGAA